MQPHSKHALVLVINAAAGFNEAILKDLQRDVNKNDVSGKVDYDEECSLFVSRCCASRRLVLCLVAHHHVHGVYANYEMCLLEAL